MINVNIKQNYVIQLTYIGVFIYWNKQNYLFAEYFACCNMTVTQQSA